MARFPFTASKQSITVFVAGRQHVIGSDHSGFRALSEHLKGENHDADFITDCVDKAKFISRMTEGNVTVHGATVYYKGQPVHGTLSVKLISMLDDGYDATPWARFMDNVMQNPSENSKQQLFDFLTSFNAPFTEDGCFVVFKRVRQNYMDNYSGKFDNSPGMVVEMDRDSVVDDPNQTCSAGLHVCALHYLNSFGYASSGRMIAVKVNPKDVVSVPVDYKFAKIRCCKYEVLGDIDYEGSGKMFSADTVENAQYIDTTDHNNSNAGKVEIGSGAVYEVSGYKITEDIEPSEGEFAYHPESGRVGKIVGFYELNYNDSDHPDNDDWVNGDMAGHEIEPVTAFEVDFGDTVQTITSYEDDADLMLAEEIEEEDVVGDNDTYTICVDTALADASTNPDGGYDLVQSGVLLAQGIDVETLMAIKDGKNVMPVAFSPSGIADPVTLEEPVEIASRTGATMAMTQTEFLDEVKALGQRGFDRKYNVPRTTVQEHLKRIGE